MEAIMKILAIDPGNEQSAWLVFDGQKPVEFGIEPNETLLQKLPTGLFAGLTLAIEMVACYGMPVGKEIFETCRWIGRFEQAWGQPVHTVYRKDEKMHLCGSMKAKDSNIRQALIDRFGPPGTKKAPGLTYGISKDIWAALAVAVTAYDKLQESPC